MGEAKRRKQLDQDYGRIPALNSQNQKQQHVDRIIDRLSAQFRQEIKEIAAAESIIEPYDRYCKSMSDWINQQLATYQPEDQTLIASSIMTCYAEIAMKYESSPLLIKFFFDVLKSLLSPEKHQQLAKIADKITAEMSSAS
ncbi:MAG: hypothetical protein AAFO95_13170 [Cyanobacteria bacterium J06600_6]